MRSNFAPRLGVRCESVFDVLERDGRRGRLVGHRPPARPVRRGRRALGHLGAADRARSTTRSPRPRAQRRRGARTPTCSCSSCSPPTSSATCAACATPSTSTSSRRPTATSATSSPSSAERGKLDGATVILMADHGQGRGIGGHGHLDWGERPVPFVVWGEGRRAGRGQRASRARCCELADDRLDAARRRAPRPPRAGARSCPSSTRASRAPPARDPAAASRSWSRATRSRAIGGGARARCPREACGMPVDVLVVDDGSRDRTRRDRPRRRRAR